VEPLMHADVGMSLRAKRGNLSSSQHRDTEIPEDGSKLCAPIPVQPATTAYRLLTTDHRSNSHGDTEKEERNPAGNTIDSREDAKAAKAGRAQRATQDEEASRGDAGTQRRGINARKYAPETNAMKLSSSPAEKHAFSALKTRFQ